MRYASVGRVPQKRHVQFRDPEARSGNGQAPLLVEEVEERFAGQGLRPEHAFAAPLARRQQFDRHRRHDRRLPDDRLMTELAHRPGVVDDVVQVDLAWRSVGSGAAHPGAGARPAATHAPPTRRRLYG